MSSIAANARLRLACFAMLALILRAGGQSPATIPDDQDAVAQRQACAKQFRQYQDEMARIDDRFAYYERYDFTTSDLKQMQADYWRIMSAWQEAFEAYENNDLAHARELKLKAESLAPPADWTARLELREKQALLMPWGEGGVGWAMYSRLQPRIEDEFDSGIEARKLASEACGKAADALDANQPVEQAAALKAAAAVAQRRAELQWWWYLYLRDTAVTVTHDFLLTPQGRKIAEPILDLARRRLSLDPLVIDGAYLPLHYAPLSPQEHKDLDPQLKEIDHALAPPQAQLIKEARAFAATHPQSMRPKVRAQPKPPKPAHPTKFDKLPLATILTSDGKTYEGHIEFDAAGELLATPVAGGEAVRIPLANLSSVQVGLAAHAIELPATLPAELPATVPVADLLEEGPATAPATMPATKPATKPATRPTTMPATTRATTASTSPSTLPTTTSAATLPTTKPAKAAATRPAGRALAATNAATKPAEKAAVSPAPDSPAVFSLPNPAAWRSCDIGRCQYAGSASVNHGVLSITTSGWGLWGPNDSFHFVYLPISGDWQMTVHVVSLQSERGLTLGGICVREGLEPDAQEFSVLAGPGGDVCPRQRPVAPRDFFSELPVNPFGVWIRLVRSGGELAGYKSADGQTWELAGRAGCRLEDEVYLGVAASTHINSFLATVVFDHISVTPGKADASGFVASDVPARGIVLRDGTVMGGDVIDDDGTKVNFVSADVAGGRKRCAIPVDEVAALLFRAVPPSFLQSLGRDEAASMLLVGGDQLEGSLVKLHSNVATVNSILLGIKEIPINTHAVAMRLNVAAPADHTWLIRARDGSRFYVSELKIESGSLLIDHPIFGQIRLPVSTLAEISAPPK